MTTIATYLGLAVAVVGIAIGLYRDEVRRELNEPTHRGVHIACLWLTYILAPLAGLAAIQGAHILVLAAIALLLFLVQTADFAATPGPLTRGSIVRYGLLTLTCAVTLSFCLTGHLLLSAVAHSVPK